MCEFGTEICANMKDNHRKNDQLFHEQSLHTNTKIDYRNIYNSINGNYGRIMINQFEMFGYLFESNYQQNNDCVK